MVHSASTDNEQAVGLTLCADDYALSPAVSAGILQLLAAGRITATGAMTNRPAWKALARELSAFSGKADLGVHLNLTCGAPLGPMPTAAPAGELPGLPRLARLALLSSAARAEIAAEIGRQLDAFEAETGRAPDFLDGHQHAHALSGVRAAVIEAARRRYGGRPGFYLRDPVDRPAAIRARPAARKAAAVAALAAGFGAAARRAGLSTNAGFSGFSRFDPAGDFAREFAGALRAPGPRHLAMCHPGLIDDELRSADSVVETRPQELAFFSGDAFPEICARAGVRLSRIGEGGSKT